MMKVEPPYEIDPIDKTTQRRMDAGEVVVGTREALEKLKLRLLPKRKRFRLNPRPRSAND